MSKVFEGRVDVEIHENKGIQLVRGDDFDASEARELLETMIATANEEKIGFDRYSLYIPEVSQNLPNGAVSLPLAKVTKALKESYEPRLTAGRWGKPRLDLYPPMTSKSTARKVTRKVPRRK